jgi:hypothetical protein
MWDVPQLPGDFWDTVQVYGGSQVTLAYWTGYDSGDRHPAVTHEYRTYSDGHAAFYKTLRKKTEERFPDARFIVDPWHPYNDCLKHIENRPDANELVPDLIVQEKGGVDFATDGNVLKSGLVDFSKLGSASPRVFTEADNRKVAGVAASKGCVFGWDAFFTEAEDLPAYTGVREVPARLKLVRMIPNWENMHRTPLDRRRWDGEVYSSPQSYISNEVIYSVQPRTDRLFVVFLTAPASVEIPDAYASASVYQTDDLFVETGVTTAVRISGNTMTLLDASQAGKGFILK